MDNKDFDEIIKKKLESLNRIDGSDDWDVFREKWNESAVDETPEVESDENLDDLFDEKIKQNLQNLRMPFNSAHWVKLKEQLEAEALFKKKLFVAKSMEIVILVFLVVGVLNILPIQQDVYQIPIYDSPMVASISVDKETVVEYKESQKKERQASLVYNNKVLREILQFPTLDKSIFDTSKTYGTSDRETQSSQPIQSINSERKSSKVIFPFTKFNNRSELKPENFLVVQKEFAELETQSLEEIYLPKRPTGFPDFVVPQKPIPEKENSFVSFSVGPKVNLINSPFDPVYEVDPYNTFNTNFNIGAKVSKDIGPVEVYTGLGYANTSYRPLIVKEKYNSQESEISEISLEKIKLSTISVPLGVKYNLIDKKSFQIYASAGVDLNLVARSDFEIVDVPIENGFAIISPPASFKAGNSNRANENSLLASKNFKNGIFDGGTLRDNIFASASISIGAVKSISKNTSLFVEPRYNHYISSNGLGPNNDKVHGLSLDVGVRYHIN